MNPRSPLQPISQLKQKVVDKNKKNYCQSHHQKTLSLYHLHHDKIIFVQRWFRSYVSKNNRRKEKVIIGKVKKRQKLLAQNHQLQDKFFAAQQERAMLMSVDKQSYLMMAAEAVIDRLRKAICGTLESAQILAYNNGDAKFLLCGIKNNEGKEENLEDEIEGLKEEYQNHKNKRKEWQDKLALLEQSIQMETAKSAELQKKLSKMKAPPLPPLPQKECKEIIEEDSLQTDQL